MEQLLGGSDELAYEEQDLRGFSGEDQIVEVILDQAKEFGRWVRDKRVQRNLTQKQAATLAGLSEVQWYRLEAGRSYPRAMTMARIYYALGEPYSSEHSRLHDFAEGIQTLEGILDRLYDLEARLARLELERGHSMISADTYSSDAFSVVDRQ